MKQSLFLFILVLATACGNDTIVAEEVNATTFSKDVDSSILADQEILDDFDLADTLYFNLVRKYIQNNGSVRQENISSIATEKVLITYFDFTIDSVKFTIDHSDRIYLSSNNQVIGNIFKQNGTVIPETNYGISNINVEIEHKNEAIVLACYRKLLIELLGANKF